MSNTELFVTALIRSNSPIQNPKLAYDWIQKNANSDNLNEILEKIIPEKLESWKKGERPSKLPGEKRKRCERKLFKESINGI